MKRIEYPARENWQQRIQSQGLVFSETQLDMPDGTQQTFNYWNEEAAYVFTMPEVLSLEKQTETLHKMCVEAAHFLAEGSMGKLGLSDAAFEYAANSLYSNEPDFYGRFDFSYQGDGSPVKMLEYNADTPTGVIEAAIAQWYWFEDRTKTDPKFAKMDQWNSLHEAFVDRWKALKRYSHNGTLHFTWSEVEASGEDAATVGYLADTARLAGWNTFSMNDNGDALNNYGIATSDIGWDSERHEWVDMENQKIESLFKLYPWEDMISEDFGAHVMHHPQSMRNWFEPGWKMFLSNKTLLAALWHLYPNHENLIPTYLDSPNGMKEYVSKPIFGREGDGIEIFAEGVSEKSKHEYHHDGGNVYQEWCPLPDFKDSKGRSNHPVLGAWVVGGESVGVGIRESDGFLTDYYCRFVPNLIED